jgi:ribose 5-phosphate isomerase A
MSDTFKKLAGEAAVEEVRDGMVLGLGTGSTVRFSIIKIGELVRDGFEVVGIPTSLSTEKLARERGIPLTTLEEHPEIDLTIDGADEVAPNLDLIKGMGGALLREKVVACASKRMVIVVDDSKLVDLLGTKSPLPVEIVPFAVAPCMKRLAGLCRDAVLREREGKAYVTDNGNNIIDCGFEGIRNPKELELTLNLIPGVMENGLFLGRADLVMVGGTEGVRRLEKPI